MRIHEQLEDVGARVRRAQQDLQVAREQVAFQTGVADDAQVRMVVSGTPLADRAFREAREDLERLRRHEERTQALVAALKQERDGLLERLLEDLGPAQGDDAAAEVGKRGLE